MDAQQSRCCQTCRLVLQAEAGSLQATIDRQKSKESQAAQMLKKYNPEGLKISDWKVMMEQNRDRLKELEQVTQHLLGLAHKTCRIAVFDGIWYKAERPFDVVLLIIITD